MNANLKIIIGCIVAICAVGITVFLSVRGNSEKAVLRTQDELLLRSMMARGGRDVAPPGGKSQHHTKRHSR